MDVKEKQDTNGKNSEAGNAREPEEPTSGPLSPNSNHWAPINQDSFSFKNIHSLRFIVQVVFSAVILIFCLSQLHSENDGKDDAIYWGGVTGILALWMPSPSSSGTLPTNQPKFETAENKR